MFGRLGLLGAGFGRMGTGGGAGTDPLAPGAPTIDLVAGSDSGSSSADNITNVTTPDIDLIANLTSGVEPRQWVEDDVITVYDDGVQTGSPHTVTALEAGGAPITLGLDALSEGPHSLQATHARDGHTSPRGAALSITVDTTAPTLSSPTGTQTGQTTATITVDVTETGGTLFYVVDQNLNTPSGAQVVAGQDQGGAAADKSGSETPAATGTRTFNITGLTAGTTYKAYFAHRDAAGNISTVSASAQFATASGTSTAAITLEDTGNTSQNGTSGGALTISAGIGTESANRKVIAVFLMPNSHDAPPTAVSINGVACTAPNGGGLQTFTGSDGAIGSFSGQIIFAWADVASGSGNQDIVITGGTGNGNGDIFRAIYTVDRSLLLDAAPTFDAGGNNVTAATSNTVSANTGAGGFVIAANVNDLHGSAASAALASSTEAMVEDFAFSSTGAGKVGPIVAKKSGVAAATPFSVTFDWTNNAQSISALMHWR